MIPLEVLSASRDAQAANFPDTATRSVRTLTSDSAGGFTAAYATSSVACRVALVVGDEEDANRAETTAQAAWITVAYNAGVTEGDRLTVGGAVWEVCSVDPPRSDRTALRCFCRRAE